MPEKKKPSSNLQGLVESSDNRYAKRKHAKPGAVDFIPKEFDNLLEDQGTRVRITPSMLCPNRTSLTDTNHVLDCPVCFGDEVVDLPNECQETWCSVTGINLDKRFEVNGIFDIKDAKMTFKAGVRVYYWYKVEVLDFASIYNQLIMRGSDNFDATRYDTTANCDTPVFCIDSAGMKYTVNEHFKMEGRGIRWLTTSRPAQGTLFSISYPILPTFRVLELLNDNRYYYIGFKQKEKIPIPITTAGSCALGLFSEEIWLNSANGGACAMKNFSIQVKLLDKGYNVDAFTEGTTAMLKAAVGGIAVAAQNEWVRLAQNRLHTTRDTYINGLRQAESFSAHTGTDVDVYEIKLVGTMPNNIEFGMPSFDMKSVRPGWLGGSKAKTAKDGHKYIMIPFRHSMSSDTRMAYTGKAAAVSGPDLKTQLKTVAKQYGLDKMIKSATGQVVEGSVARVPNVATVHPYLRGLTRVQKADGPDKKRGSGTMTTWRIMSENSPADSWIHPGIPAANLLAEVESFVDQQIDKIISDLLAA